MGMAAFGWSADAVPELKLPLIGSFNTRGPFDSFQILTDSEKDQIFSNCTFSVPQNPVTQSGRVYCEKLRAYTVLISDSEATYTAGYEIVASDFSNTNWVFSALGDNNKIDLATGSKIFAWNTGIARLSMGIATGGITNIVETIIGGAVTFLMTSNDGTGWFLAKDSITTNNTSVNVGDTFTANRTSGNVQLTSVSSFAGLYVGQLLTGTGIAANARIASMNSGAGTLDMTIAATSGAATSTTVTHERIAKIIDADFPSGIIGPFACLDGFNFIMTATAIYSSNLNSIVSWTAGDFISTNFYPDNARGGVWVIGNRIFGFSTGSAEAFYNAGNPSGSPLSRSTELNFPIGAINSRCIVNIEGRIYFISGLNSGSAAMFMLNGSTPVEMPTSQLNSLLASSDTGQTVPIVLTAFRMNGKLYIVFGGLYAYDVEYKIWSLWGYRSTTTPQSNAVPMRASGVFGSGNYARTRGEIHFVNSSLSGTRLLSSSPTSSAADFAGPLLVRTSRIDLDTGNRKFVEYYELDSDVQASGTATLEASDDDYATWFTVGTFDMTTLSPRISPGGSWVGGRAHRLTHSADTPFRASTLTIKYAAGQM